MQLFAFNFYSHSIDYMSDKLNITNDEIRLILAFKSKSIRNKIVHNQINGRRFKLFEKLASMIGEW